MFKQALYTYWTSLHPRNIKYIIHKRWVTFVLFFVFLPNVTEIKQNGAGAFYPFTVFFPIVLMKMSNLAQKISIPKALFLAPMQQEERENYIKYLIGIKIGVSMLLGLFIQLVWKRFYPISWIDVLICMFVYLSYGIAEYFCVEGALDDGSRIEHGVRGEDGKITVSSSNWMAIACAILMYIVLPLNLTEEIPIFMQAPAQIPLLLLLFFYDIVIIIRQYRDMLNTICKYEPEIKPEK